MSDAFKPLLGRLADGATLSEEDAVEFFAACFRGEPTPAQIAAAITAMRMRGETVGEITASARAMRKAAVMLDHPFEVMDVCGTGGDGLAQALGVGGQLEDGGVAFRSGCEGRHAARGADARCCGEEGIAKESAAAGLDLGDLGLVEEELGRAAQAAGALIR